MDRQRIIQIHRPVLHDGQRQIINSSARFKCISAGRRFGKTMLACYWIAMREGSAISGKPVAYFAPTYKLLMDVWKKLKRALQPILSNSNRTEMSMELVTGGTIDFWTLQDVDAGRGRKYARIVIDEAAHARYLEEAWDQSISSTLMDLCGEAWFISTPKGINYFHDLYQRSGGPGFSDWESFCMPTSVNPHISPQEIERKRNQTPELVFRQEQLAEFVIFGAGMVKPEYLELGVAPPRLPVVLGVDLAISAKETSDWTAIVAMSRDPVTGIIYIIEVERHRCAFNEILGHIRNAAIRHKPVMIVIEQAQFQAAVVQELARTTKFPVRGIRPDRDKITRFAPLLTRYEQRLVRHDPARVPNWFREELLAFPDGKHDDAVDAAAYAYMKLPMATSGTLKPVPTEHRGW